MKIELLPDSEFTDAELVRIFEFNTSQLIVFRDALRELITSGKSFSTATFLIEEIDGCQIQFVISQENNGLHRNANGELICALSVEGYKRFIDMLNHQIDDGSGYRWLDEYIDSTEISLLLSEGGGW